MGGAGGCGAGVLVMLKARLVWSAPKGGGGMEKSGIWGIRVGEPMR